MLLLLPLLTLLLPVAAEDHRKADSLRTWRPGLVAAAVELMVVVVVVVVLLLVLLLAAAAVVLSSAANPTVASAILPTPRPSCE